MADFHRGYTRFVILTAARCGTHMVRSALLSHPAVVVHHELFNETLGAYHAYTHRASVQEILDQHAYRPMPESVAAVGFPILEEHANDRRAPQWQEIWNLIRKDRDLRVVRLYRENLLRQHVSRVRARLLREWHCYPGETATERDIAYRADAQYLEQLFRNWSERRERADQLCRDHRSVRISYEALVANPQAHLDEVQRLLGIETLPLEPMTRKQATQPLSRTLENYRELKSHFAHGPWARFFDE